MKIDLETEFWNSNLFVEHDIGVGAGGHAPLPPHTFWPSLVAKDRDTFYQHSLPLELNTSGNSTDH